MPHKLFLFSIITIASVALFSTSSELINDFLSENSVEKNSLLINGMWHIMAIDSDGKIIDERRSKNIITTEGMRAILSNVFQADMLPSTNSAGDPHNLSVGDCGGTCTTPTVDDLALENPTLNNIPAIRTPIIDSENHSITLEYIINHNGEQTIREAGLHPRFNPELLVNRVIFADIIEPAGGQIVVSVTIQLANPP